MANRFVFGGASIVAPGILVSTTIAQNRVLQLLPFGRLCFLGASDGGLGGGTVYQFDTLQQAQAVLRGGSLLNAFRDAAVAGAPSGLVAVVCGTKVSGTLTLAGASSSHATLTAGDQGAWTNQIKIKIVAGSTSGVQVIFTFPDALSGQTVTIGGPNTKFDNLVDFLGLQAAILADPILTPVNSPVPPIVVLSAITNGVPTQISATPLASGAGDGTAALVAADITPGVDNLIDIPFDISHIVKVYDSTSQAYLDGQNTALEPKAFLRRAIHQIAATGAAPTNTKIVNSGDVEAALATRAALLNSKRSSVVAQQIKVLNPQTGVYELHDAAPFICGMAAVSGATGAWGLATPLTYDFIPSAVDVDYPVLQSTGDLDNAILAGGMVLQRVGVGINSQVRIVQSVTTAPTGPNPSTGVVGPWDFAEFSIVRASDGILANVVASVSTASPKVIGGGNDLKTMNAVVADVHDVLEAALNSRWITSYDPTSIQITTSPTQSDADLVQYSVAPTRPLNHLGIAQTLIPFQATVTLNGPPS